MMSSIWQLVISSIVFLIIYKAGEALINRYVRRNKEKLTQRSQTIAALVNSIFHYTVLFFYLFAVLSILGVPVGTLLASASILSLAIGMGAQGFVSDIVNGFFILSEGQYDVGDLVQIGENTGTVVQLGIRSTKLKSSDGSLIFIPNRNITIVQNLAKGGIGLNIDLELDAANDLDEINRILTKVNQETPHDPAVLLKEPVLSGVISQAGSTILYRVHFQVQPGEEGKIRNLYFSRYLDALKANGIKFPKTALPKTSSK
ncbi:small-conductance mechanosensitive channel [Lactobacillus corticis]|uniref:Small-conductance mechanosensitive channel n=1 Tax=Lactobacillus corticis TaxID=2201249 RepID=A0A916QHC3_9LACO|nr:small-conductance mechanosensitive channel [Lactobacillus corticis]